LSRLQVGRVIRPHGLRGEVLVEGVSNRPERFTAGSVLVAGGREMVVLAGRPFGGPEPAGRPARGKRWLVSFEGVIDRDGAEALRGAVLEGQPLDDDLPEGEWWVHDLVGAEVVDLGGRLLGRVEAVEANPAHDLLVLEGGGLVPVVFVVETAPGRVVVDPPAGLLD
jgi:16S rRNA processing protein RimM